MKRSLEVINTNEFMKYGGSAVIFPNVWNANRHIRNKMDYTIEQVYRWIKSL